MGNEIRSRQCIVRSAQGWFDESRKAQNAGLMREALLYMENAFNHTENALAAALEKARFTDALTDTEIGLVLMGKGAR